MERKERGLTLLEMVVAITLTTVLAGAAAVMMITMQKSYSYTRSGSSFTQQASLALQIMERDLRYGLLETNAGCGDALDEKFASPLFETDNSAIKVITPDSAVIEYRREAFPCSLDGNESCYRILRTKKRPDAAGTGCEVVEADREVAPPVFTVCNFKLSGSVITITLRGLRENPLGVKSDTREIVKTIHLTDFSEGTA